MSLGWMLIRGSGLTAYVLLALAAIWGLLASTKALGGTQTKSVTWFHESLSIGSLVATVVHMVALALHDYMPFSLKELLVPGASTFKPLGVAWGVVAFYSIAVIVVSFYVKRHIGQAAWRTVHYASFGTFAAATMHGLTVGTDRANPAVLGMYVAAVSTVLLLTVIRLAAGASRPGSARTATSGASRSEAIARARLRAVGSDPVGETRAGEAAERAG